MILDPAIIECPHCHLNSMHYVVMSGTIYSCDSYSDGKTDNIIGAYAANPYVVHCRNCSGYYFFHEARNDSVQNSNREPFGDLQFEETHLGAREYAECLKSMKNHDAEKEMTLRFLFWRSVNDLIRRDAYFGSKRTWYNDLMNFLILPIKNWKRIHPRYSEYLEWKKQKDENLERLLELLVTDGNEDNDLVRVEIYRELGQFKKAKKILKEIPAGGSRKFITFQRKLIARRDPFVRKCPS